MAAETGGEFLACESAPLPDGGKEEEWNRRRSTMAAWVGAPRHAANDVVVRPDSSVAVTGKFSYGLIHWDLEHEAVELWLDDCSGRFRWLGRSETDGDGRARFEVFGDDLPGPGRYRLLMRVPGDNSFTETRLRVLPRGTRFVVFDIDETVSAEGVWGTLEDAFRSKDDERAREAAAEVSRVRHREQGCQIVYLTARNYAFTELTRRWLEGNGFAPGTLIHSRELRDKWPSDDGAGRFKAQQLRELQESGFEIAFAYGNASTDWYAYRAVGLSPDRIVMLGWDEDGTETGFEAHLERIRREGPVAQPCVR